IPWNEDVWTKNVHPSASKINCVAFGQLFIKQSLVPVLEEPIVAIQIESGTHVILGGGSHATTDDDLDRHFVFSALVVEFGLEVNPLGSDIHFVVLRSREVVPGVKSRFDFLAALWKIYVYLSFSCHEETIGVLYVVGNLVELARLLVPTGTNRLRTKLHQIPCLAPLHIAAVLEAEIRKLVLIDIYQPFLIQMDCHRTVPRFGWIPKMCGHVYCRCESKYSLLPTRLVATNTGNERVGFAAARNY